MKATYRRTDVIEACNRKIEVITKSREVKRLQLINPYRKRLWPWSKDRNELEAEKKYHACEEYADWHFLHGKQEGVCQSILNACRITSDERVTLSDYEISSIGL